MKVRPKQLRPGKHRRKNLNVVSRFLGIGYGKNRNDTETLYRPHKRVTEVSNSSKVPVSSLLREIAVAPAHNIARQRRWYFI